MRIEQITTSRMVADEGKVFVRKSDDVKTPDQVLREDDAPAAAKEEQAAEALGVSTQTVSRWECNTTLPDVMLLPKIADSFNITIDALF